MTLTIDADKDDTVSRIDKRLMDRNRRRTRDLVLRRSPTKDKKNFRHDPSVAE
jgi:hypothetical protein